MQPVVALKQTGAVDGDFVTDLLKQFFHSLLQIHQLIGLVLQQLLIFIVALLKICKTTEV